MEKNNATQQPELRRSSTPGISTSARTVLPLPLYILKTECTEWKLVQQRSADRSNHINKPKRKKWQRHSGVSLKRML